MTTVEFHPAVELLTSSTGGSIHIIKFKDETFFNLFSQNYLKRSSKIKSNLEFCYLEADKTHEEVLIIKHKYYELHFHGGKANVEFLKYLLNKLDYNDKVSKNELEEAWYKVYQQTKADHQLEYLLKIRDKAICQDTEYFNTSENFDLEGYEFLEPVKIMLLGPPNAGKSTLFNYLIGEQRALVSDIEGTTRDSLSASLTFGGYEVTLMDTAGLRESSLLEGTKVEDNSIQTLSERIVLNLAKDIDLFCLFNTPTPPNWIPIEKIIHLRSKSDLNHDEHPDALSFSIHKNIGCQDLIKTITDKVIKLREGSVSPRFIKPS